MERNLKMYSFTQNEFIKLIKKKGKLLSLDYSKGIVTLVIEITKK